MRCTSCDDIFELDGDVTVVDALESVGVDGIFTFLLEEPDTPGKVLLRFKVDLTILLLLMMLLLLLEVVLFMNEGRVKAKKLFKLLPFFRFPKLTLLPPLERGEWTG